MQPDVPQEPRIGDAFGRALLEYLEVGDDGWGHIVERDDGLVEWMSPGIFVDQPSIWSRAEAPVPGLVRGRILDVGAGGGRHSAPLTAAGHDVTALDVSEGALEVCRRRGVRQVVNGSLTDLAPAEPFDTVLLCGNNLGLLGSERHAPAFLEAVTRITAPGARIVGTCFDPFDTTDRLHLEYHELNRRRGRLPGQLRLRVRWTNLATPWFDYLYLPVDQLGELARQSGWELVEARAERNPYLAVLQRAT